MKKGLIGIVILAFVALFCGPAFAIAFESIDVEATLEWTIFDETGFMPGTSYDAPALAVPDLTLTSGPWSAGTDDGAWDYFKYTAEMATVGLYAATSYAIYDLEKDIAEAQGITLETAMAALSLDVAYTAGEDYGVGGTYDAGLFSVGAKYNSTEAYGVQVEYPVDDFTLTGQYAIGSAYLVKGAYALTGERAFTDDSAITLQYKVIDAAEILAELVDFPISDTIMLQLGVTSAEDGVDLSGEVVTTLAEGVTLTLNAASTEGVLTYFGKIGVSF